MMPYSHAAGQSRWPTFTLAEVATLFVGLPTARHLASTGEQGADARVVSVGDIQDGRLIPADALSTIRLKPGAAERFRICVGDLVFACRGTLLKSALVTAESEGLVASSSLIVIRSGPRILPAVLLSMLRSSSWKSTLHQRTRSSTGLMQFTVKDIQDLPVPVPPMDVQSDLASLVEAEDEHHRWALLAAEKRRELTMNAVEHMLRNPSQSGG